MMILIAKVNLDGTMNIKKQKLKFRYIFLAIFVSVFSSSNNLLAMGGGFDPEFFSRNNITFYNPDDIGCVPVASQDGSGDCQVNMEKLASTTTDRVSANVNNANIIINRLSTTEIQGYTLSLNQIAAILGNGIQESNLNPDAVSASGTYHGIFQWNESRYGSTSNIDSIDKQIDLLISEMEEGYWANRMAGIGGLVPGNFFEMDNVDDLAEKFVGDFEGATDGAGSWQHLAERQQFAREIRAAIECSETSIDDDGSANVTTQQAAFFDKFYETARQVNIDYGLPWEAILSQAALETGYGTSNISQTKKNYFGFAAYDDETGAAYDVSDLTDEEAFYQIGDWMANNFAVHLPKSWFNFPNDPNGYIRELQNLPGGVSYATDREYESKNRTLIATISNYANSQDWEISSQVTSNNLEALENAQIYADGAEKVTSGFVGSDDECGISGSNRPIAGGMNLQQAGEFMRSYYDLSDTDPDLLANIVGAGTGCLDGPKSNCVSFSTYFMNKYTDLNHTKSGAGNPGNGNQFVTNALSYNPDRLQLTNQVAPYTLFSHETGSAFGHTGIILGVDRDRNVAIIGEANCSLTGFTTNGYAGVGVREQSLDVVRTWELVALENHLIGGF